MTSLLLQMLFVCVCECVTNFHDTVFLPVQWSVQTVPVFMTLFVFLFSGACD